MDIFPLNATFIIDIYRRGVKMAYEKDLDDIMENAQIKVVDAEGICYAYIVDHEGNIISPIALRLEEEE
tara:strand:+ start:426 stop:632 length:207 start_codon:yes stop_codon:yes gene_type:complete